MKSIVALALVAVASAYSHDEVFSMFSTFMVNFDKQYASPEEFETRMAIFEENLNKIDRMNADLIAQGNDAVNGVGPFTDLTEEEFKATYLMKDYTPFPRTEELVYGAPEADDVDWRQKGAITAVKDQGQCGSCWAFSATAAIESYNFLAGKGLLVLSPQQIVSCDTRDGGCNGGNTESAYQYVHTAGGQELEASYPYTSGHGVRGSCRFDPSKIAARITGYRSVARSETALAAALNQGPVSVCLAADAFQHYTGGILTSCPGRIDHCVQAVGYAADHWIVRNSWSTRWGEGGYIRIKRGANLCQIANDITYPTI
jgi:hypothetical protein